MSYYEHLPIYKKMFDIVVYIEQIVKNFSRYHKYTLGTEMRNLYNKVQGELLLSSKDICLVVLVPCV